MPTIHACDKCGKELSTLEERLFSVYLADHKEHGFDSSRTMLCHECQEPVLVFLKGYLARKYGARAVARH